MIDLDENHIDEVKTILHRLVPRVEVLAFGSRVRSGSRKLSDLDLALVDDIDWRVVEALKDAFSESDLPFRVDVVLLRHLPDSIQADIESNHTVLQTAPS